MCHVVYLVSAAHVEARLSVVFDGSHAFASTRGVAILGCLTQAAAHTIVVVAGNVVNDIHVRVFICDGVATLTFKTKS